MMRWCGSAIICAVLVLAGCGRSMTGMPASGADSQMQVQNKQSVSGTNATSVQFLKVATGSSGNDVVAGADGFMYFTFDPKLNADDGDVGKFDPASGQVDAFESGPVNVFLQTPDHALWGTGTIDEPNTLLRIAPFSPNGMTKIKLPPTKLGSQVAGMAYDPVDENVYFSDIEEARLGKISAAGPYTTDAMKMLHIPNGPPGSPGAVAQPMGVAASADGGVVFTDADNGTVYVLRDGTLKPFVTPAQLEYACTEITSIAVDDTGTSYVGGSAMLNPGCNEPAMVGEFYSMTQAGAFTSLQIPKSGVDWPNVSSTRSGRVAFLAAVFNAVGVYFRSTGVLEVLPMQAQPTGNGPGNWAHTPANVAIAADDSIWFTTKGYFRAIGPLYLGHLVLGSVWKVFPSRTLTVNIGQQSQLIGIGESGDSGPFTATSSDTSIVSVKALAGGDHDFYLTRGSTTGTATVTVRDGHGRSVPVMVTNS